MTISISVIIPLFNAENYIEKAIRSAINQKEVKEVIIIDDGSTDNSLEICFRLKKENNKIHIYQHQDCGNHGRSRTKNLGIRKSKYNFISFLDADDFYLPRRFEMDVEKFQSNPLFDGVYNAIGGVFYRKANPGEEERFHLTTLQRAVEPEKLFRAMYPIGHLGHFSGNGLTVKRSLLEKTGYFNENLEVAEDTELWVRLSLLGTLVPGIIDQPVAMRGIHEQNVSFKNDKLYRENNEKMFEILLNWAFENNIESTKRNILWERALRIRKENGFSNHELSEFIQKKIRLNPRLLFSKHTFRYVPLFRRIKNLID